jgi:hypothetical protein
VPRTLVIALLAFLSAAAFVVRPLPHGPAAAARGPVSGPAYWNTGPSAASEPTPQRRRFIRRADRTCARSLARGRSAQAAYARRVAGRPDARERVTRFHARWHEREYAALRALGEPPDARLEYRAFLATIAERVRLEGRYVPLVHAGRAAEAQALADRVSALEARGDALGRRFGLVACAAGGR